MSIVVDLINRSSVTVANSSEADAQIPKRLDETEFDEITKAQFDLVVIILVIRFPKRIGMMGAVCAMGVPA